MRHLLLVLGLVLGAKAALALNVTINLKVEGESKPVIVGKTNLPDGIKLMVSMRRKESSYFAQAQTHVRAGEFRAGPFSQNGNALNSGAYAVEVSSPLATFQPPQTWPIIGNEGAKLSGPLVKKSKFGGGTVIEYKTIFKVATGRISPEQDRAARMQSAKARHEWWLRSCKDNCNKVQLLAQQRGESFDWERCHYKCIADDPTK